MPDRFSDADARRLMASITMVFGLAPAVAPVTGGLVAGSAAGARRAGRTSPAVLRIGFACKRTAAVANLAGNRFFEAELPWASCPSLPMRSGWAS